MLKGVVLTEVCGFQCNVMDYISKFFWIFL